jgi:hypothetical protein
VKKIFALLVTACLLLAACDDNRSGFEQKAERDAKSQFDKNKK